MFDEANRPSIPCLGSDGQASEAWESDGFTALMEPSAVLADVVLSRATPQEIVNGQGTTIRKGCNDSNISPQAKTQTFQSLR